MTNFVYIYFLSFYKIMGPFEILAVFVNQPPCVTAVRKVTAMAQQ
jgi:hypothetical protein